MAHRRKRTEGVAGKKTVSDGERSSSRGAVGRAPCGLAPLNRRHPGGGPFSIFMSVLVYPDRDADPFYDRTLKAYSAWQGFDRKEEFQRRYYERLGGGDAPAGGSGKPAGCSGLQFKMEYVEQTGHYRMQRVKITPYFLWLGWYLKNHATAELLAKDTLDIALELGRRWNSMGQRSKARWADVAARECRGKLWRGKNDKDLPDWYLDNFR